MQTRRPFKSRTSLFNQRSACAAALLAQGLLLAACVSEDVDPEGVGGTSTSGAGGTGNSMNNTGGTGNTMTTNGGSNAGGAGGITANPEYATVIPCVAPTQALIMDFAPPAAMPGADAGADAAPPAAMPLVDGSFGDFTTTFSGGTYRYPNAGAYPIDSDVSGGNWHLSGDVGDYSGFGIYIGGMPTGAACTVVDLSAYGGISFTISGSVPMGNTLTMSVATSGNNASHVYLNTVAMPAPNPPAAVNSGRCIPPGANQYDGSCTAASTTITVTAQPTTVTVLWTEFANGRPEAMVNPEEITGIAWAFPAPPGAGTTTPTPYAVDLVIDDIQFVPLP